MANPFITFFNFVVNAWKTADTLGKINMVLTAATLAVGVKGYMQQRAMMAKGQDILGQKTGHIWKQESRLAGNIYVDGIK